MKRKLLHLNPLKRAALAVPAAALMLGASHGAQIGLNIQTWWPQYGGPTPGLGFGYQTTGWPVTAAAFGLSPGEWTSSLPLDGYSAVNTNVVFGGLTAKLEARNPWASGIGWSGGWTQATVTPGNDEVTWGYLDDSGTGPQVTISGFRNIASSFTVQTIAAIGGSQDSFPDVTLTTNGIASEILDYTNGTYAAVSGTVGTSTVSTVYTTLTGNNSITLKAGNRDSRRSTIAGIIVKYTPGNNPPLIETNPQVPVGQIFPGGTFAMSSLASGAPTLNYQWRKGGNAIPGATFASYTNSSAVVGDTGDYDVVVTNLFGAVTSAVVHVTVLSVVQPVITRSPLPQTLFPGYPATFSVEATGGQLAYQWKKGTTLIETATTSTYSIPSIVAADQDTYTVTVSNPTGNAQASASLTVKVPIAGSYEAAVAQTKPLLWFRTGEIGPVTQDTVANSGTIGAAGLGLVQGAVTHPVTGALVGSSDKAATLGGGKITVAYNATLNPNGPFTLECWVNPATSSGSGAIVQSMINGENTGNGNDRSGWALRQNDSGLRFLVGTDSGAPFYYYYTVDTGIAAGVWQHVAVVYNGTAPSIYINGVLTAYTVTRADNVAMTQPEIDAIRIMPNNAAPLIVGDRGYGGWTFAGGVDELAIYPSALTPAQLLAHYQNGTSATPATPYNTLVTAAGAAEFLRLNDTPNLSVAANSGTLGADWNGSYNDAGSTLGSPQIAKGIVGPRPPGQPGLESTNLAFVMTNGFVSAPICTNLNGNTITIAGWVKPEEIPSGGDLGWPCWLGQGGMHIENSSGRPTRELRYHWSGNEHWGWGSGLVAPADVWTFVALVIEPTKATMYMSDGTSLKSSVNAVAHNPVAMSSPLGFGGNQPASPARTYKGGLDEMTVYNRALTQSEINSLFMVGSGAKLQLTLSNGGIIEDTKPSGTPHHGVNTSVSTAWVASSTDVANPAVTRTGVAQFATANQSQITIAADPDFNSTVGTIMFWVRANAPIPGPGDEAAILFDRRTSAGTVISINDAGSLFVQCAGGANSFTAGYLPDDGWHHVAVTYDQSASGFVGIFIDGVSYNSQLNTAAWSWPATQQIELGRSHDGYWKRLDGQMDDFRIYNRVLTEAEIASVKASDALVDSSALKLRYNFSTTGIGKTVSWPFGTLESSPVLGPGATWAPVPGAVGPNYPFLPTEPQLYFRAIP